MESYIRPGCVILSVYVAMSASAWEQVGEFAFSHWLIVFEITKELMCFISSVFSLRKTWCHGSVLWFKNQIFGATQDSWSTLAGSSCHTNMVGAHSLVLLCLLAHVICKILTS